MNVSTLDVGSASASTAPRRAVHSSAPVRTRRRPRVGRGTGPEARPPRPLGFATPRPAARAQACAVQAPPVVEMLPPARWRLTERGIALVLATGLLIVAASLTVVGLTALRVTGAAYRVAGQSLLAQP